MDKAVFLDRDGVINEATANKDFYYKKEDIRILPGVKEALKKIKEKGYRIFVVTNQPVIARGIATESEIGALHLWMNAELGGMIDKFYVCPHHPEMHPDVPPHAIKYRIACSCRKPSPGLILQAAAEFNINLEGSWLMGDMASDILAGKNAGCKTIFIQSEHSVRMIKAAVSAFNETVPDVSAKSLLDAVRYV